MLEKLFGPSPDSGKAVRKKVLSEFDLDNNIEVPHSDDETVRRVYVLGNENCRFLPDLDVLAKLPQIAKMQREGLKIHIDVHYVYAFNIAQRMNVSSVIASWNAVMDVFKATDESEVDDVILVGPCYSSVLEGRRIFLEKVYEKIGMETDRYEHIRKCLEYYAPVFLSNKFNRWARI